MTSKTPVRKCDDVDQQALSYSEIKTLCTGDERIKEKMQLDNEVKGLKMLRAEYVNTKHEMEDKIFKAPLTEKRLLSNISKLEQDKSHIDKLPLDPETEKPKFRITIGKITYTDRTEAAKAFETAALEALPKCEEQAVQLGEFQGFPLSIRMKCKGEDGSRNYQAELKGASAYGCNIGSSFSNNLKRLESTLYTLDEKIAEYTAELTSHRLDVEEAKKIAEQPFAWQEELESKSNRLKELTEELNTEAMESLKNSPQRQRTNFFDCAKLRKEAQRIHAQEKKQKKDKKREKEGDLDL